MTDVSYSASENRGDLQIEEAQLYLKLKGRDYRDSSPFLPFYQSAVRFGNIEVDLSYEQARIRVDVNIINSTRQPPPGFLLIEQNNGRFATNAEKLYLRGRDDGSVRKIEGLVAIAEDFQTKRKERSRYAQRLNSHYARLSRWKEKRASQESTQGAIDSMEPDTALVFQR